MMVDLRDRVLETLLALGMVVATIADAMFCPDAGPSPYWSES